MTKRFTRVALDLASRPFTSHLPDSFCDSPAPWAQVSTLEIRRTQPERLRTKQPHPKAHRPAGTTLAQRGSRPTPATARRPEAADIDKIGVRLLQTAEQPGPVQLRHTLTHHMSQVDRMGAFCRLSAWHRGQPAHRPQTLAR